jgi:uncharacterized membrane protein
LSTIESNKTMALIGTILLIIGVFVPYGGAVVQIIGIILLMMAIKGFSNYYRDPEMYQNAFTGILYYIIAAIAGAVALGSLALGIASVSTLFVIGLGLGIIVFIVALVIAFIFYLLAASRLRRTFYDLSQKTGEQSLHTAGTLLWIGALLSIILVGWVLIFIAWIFAALGFFNMRVPYQQPYGYTQPPPAPAPTQAARYCPHCGAPVDASATFCPNCGQKLPPP